MKWRWDGHAALEIVLTQWRQSVRIVSSVLLSQLIARLIGLHEPYWALMTAIIVTQIRISQTYSIARDQIIGTLMGAVAGIVAIYASLQGIDRWIVFWVMLVPLAGLTATRPNFRLASVTLAVVFLFPSVGGAFSRPLDRVMAILTGVISSVIVSYLVLPSSARKDVFLAGAEVLEAIETLLTQTMKQKMWWSDVEEMNDASTTALQKVAEAVKEVRQEHPITALEAYDPLLVKLPRILRRLQSDSVFIARALSALPAEDYENVLGKRIPETLSALSQRLAHLCQEEAKHSPYVYYWKKKVGLMKDRPASEHNKDVTEPFKAAFDPFRNLEPDTPLSFSLLIFEHDFLWLERVIRTGMHGDGFKRIMFKRKK